MPVVEALLLDYEQAAAVLSLSRAALRDLVYKGKGPTIVKLGRRTLFAVSDLQSFVEQHREAPRDVTARANEYIRRSKRGRPSLAELMAKRAA